MKTLVLGTCCLDLVMNMEEMPKIGTDINASSLSLNMGGMAYNVYQTITFLGQEAILGSPCGQGPLADLINVFFKEKGVKPFVRTKDMDNGVCLCLVGEKGERTFIAYHGAEYKFNKDWYKDLDFSKIDMIYFSGLEVEEDTEGELISFLEEKKKPLLFAPSSRVVGIKEDVLERIYKLQPIIHVNEYEVKYMSKENDIEKAAEIIFKKTNVPVIVTLGEKGAYIKTDVDECFVPTESLKPEEIVDSVGAGDSHAGALIVGLKKGYDIKEAVKFANKVARSVLTHAGAGVIEN